MGIYVCDVPQRPSLAIVQVLQTCFGIKSSRHFEEPVFMNPQTSADCRECLANMAVQPLDGSSPVIIMYPAAF